MVKGRDSIEIEKKTERRPRLRGREVHGESVLKLQNVTDQPSFQP